MGPASVSIFVASAGLGFGHPYQIRPPATSSTATAINPATIFPLERFGSGGAWVRAGRLVFVLLRKPCSATHTAVKLGTRSSGFLAVQREIKSRIAGGMDAAQ